MPAQRLAKLRLSEAPPMVAALSRRLSFLSALLSLGKRAGFSKKSKLTFKRKKFCEFSFCLAPCFASAAFGEVHHDTGPWHSAVL